MQRTPGSTRTDTLFPYTTPFRSLRSIDERAHVRSIPWSPAHEGLVCQSRPTWPFPDRCVADYGRPRAGRAWPDCGPSADQDSHPAHFRASGAVDHAVGRVARQKIGRHTSELQSLMRISYAVFCLIKKKTTHRTPIN